MEQEPPLSSTFITSFYILKWFINFVTDHSLLDNLPLHSYTLSGNEPFGRVFYEGACEPSSR